MTTKSSVAPGRYTVMLDEPKWERLEPKAGDECRMALCIPCNWGLVDGTTHTEYFRMYFTRQIVQKGKNSGKTLATVNADECIRLGMSEPFDPGKVGELVGQIAELVMQEDTYEGQTRVIPRFLNPQSANRIDADEAREMWAKMTGGGGAPAATAVPAKAEDDVLNFN